MIADLLLTAAVAAYTHWLPGPRTFCWEPSSGAVVGYEVEQYWKPSKSSEPLLVAETSTDASACIQLWFPSRYHWWVRVRGFSADGEVSVWSEDSAIYWVEYPADINADGLVGNPDFNSLRVVWGLCADETGFGGCE